MKKSAKILSILMIAILVATLSTSVFALTDPSTITASSTGADTTVTNMGGKVLSFVQVVGSVVAVAILAVLGVKYMMGSSEEKAEYKKSMMPYIVGAVIVFAASNLAGMIFNFATSI